MASKQIDYTGAPIYAEPVAWQYTVHLDEIFAEKGDYRSVLNLLTEASENDVISFLVNNHGGDLNIILPLINLLNVAQAHTIALCAGSQSSAATVFAMYCDELIALDHAEFMIHEIQGGAVGTMSNVVRDIHSTERRNKRLVEETYGGFLTDEEIKDVLRGVEIYLNDEEINRRWPLRKAWREEFYQQKQQKLQEMIEAAINAAAVEEHKHEDKPKPRRKRTVKAD